MTVVLRQRQSSENRRSKKLTEASRSQAEADVSSDGQGIKRKPT